MNLYYNALGSVGFVFPERIYLSELSLYFFSKATIKRGIYTFLIEDSVLGGSITIIVLPFPNDILSTVLFTNRHPFFMSMFSHLRPQISPTLRPVYRLNNIHRFGKVSLLSKYVSSFFLSLPDKILISFFLTDSASGFRKYLLS